MRSLLVVCPTRNRPERCRQMLDSFSAMSSKGTQLACYVADDDPQLPAYEELASSHAVFDFGPWRSMPDVFNHYFRTTAYDYYAVCNDDFIYRTPRWDEKLVTAIEERGGVGMSYGRPNGVLPDSAVFSARSLRALGYWMPPGFLHKHVDVVLTDLFTALKQAYRLEEVYTEHVHPAFGTAPMDVGYLKIYCGEDSVKDDAAYRYWREHQRAADLERLRSAELVTA